MQISRVKINRKTALERNKNNIAWSIGAFVFGAALLGSGIPLYIKNTSDWMWMLLIVLGGFLIIGSIGLCFMVLRYGSQANAANTEVETSLEDDFILITIYKKGEKVTDSKVNYRDILYVKTTKSYLFAFMAQNQAIPMERRDGLLAFLLEKGIQKK